MKFKCECEKEEKETFKATTKLVEGKWVQDVKCSCDKYMKQIAEEEDGWPTIIRNEAGFRKTSRN
tara:strand:- start:223 stop:417 length:195 start_codon:yes stop_codon:yes gene_type:complete